MFFYELCDPVNVAEKASLALEKLIKEKGLGEVADAKSAIGAGELCSNSGFESLSDEDVNVAFAKLIAYERSIEKWEEYKKFMMDIGLWDVDFTWFQELRLRRMWERCQKQKHNPCFRFHF